MSLRCFGRSHDFKWNGYEGCLVCTRCYAVFDKEKHKESDISYKTTSRASDEGPPEGAEQEENKMLFDNKQYAQAHKIPRRWGHVSFWKRNDEGGLDAGSQEDYDEIHFSVTYAHLPHDHFRYRELDDALRMEIVLNAAFRSGVYHAKDSLKRWINGT